VSAADQLSAKLAHARVEIADHLEGVRALFNEPVKLTIIVRNPAHPNGTRDLVLTDDTTEEAIAALRQLEEIGRKTPPDTLQ
jgi:hypothetical protein